MVLTVPGRSGPPSWHADHSVQSPGPPLRRGRKPGCRLGAQRPRGAGTLSRGGKTLKVNIVELSAPEARAVMLAYPENVPVGVRLAKRSEWVREGTADVIDGGNSRYTEFEALAGRIPVFRFDPITP